MNAHPAAPRPIASAQWTRPRSASPPVSWRATAIAGQGFDIDVDDTRRMRLLAFVDASFYAPIHGALREALPDLHRRSAVVLRQHPVHDGLPVAHRHLALHRPDRRRPVRRLASSSTGSTTSSPVVWAACAPDPARTPAAARKSMRPIGICYLKRVAADYRGETRREIAAAVERSDRRDHRRRREWTHRRARARP